MPFLGFKASKIFCDDTLWSSTTKFDSESWLLEKFLKFTACLNFLKIISVKCIDLPAKLCTLGPAWNLVSNQHLYVPDHCAYVFNKVCTNSWHSLTEVALMIKPAVLTWNSPDSLEGFHPTRDYWFTKVVGVTDWLITYTRPVASGGALMTDVHGWMIGIVHACTIHTYTQHMAWHTHLQLIKKNSILHKSHHFSYK